MEELGDDVGKGPRLSAVNFNQHVVCLQGRSGAAATELASEAKVHANGRVSSRSGLSFAQR